MSDEYDAKVNDTIPFYEEFHQTVIDLVVALKQTPLTWLDTGCGTGNLCLKAHQKMPDITFTLADPAFQMLKIAKEKTQNENVTFIQADSQSIDCKDNTFDVITAIQCHHYLYKETRKSAVENCFRMLKPNGLFITFENILPFTETGIKIALKRWGNFQIVHGKSQQEAENHLKRFNTEYFPITISEHIDLLKGVGFSTTEILWVSYMQAGFYAIKST